MANFEFQDYAASSVMNQQLAEAYERHHAWAAQDFVNWQDNNTRQRLVDSYIVQLHTAIQTLAAQLQSHTHIAPQAPSGAIPTNPPTNPINFRAPQGPAQQQNTTGRSTNRNHVPIPFAAISYIDASGNANINKPVSIFRRATRLTENTTPLIPPLTLE